MREYVVVPSSWLEGDDDELRAWALAAARYGPTLPQKKSQKKTGARKPAGKPAARKRGAAAKPSGRRSGARA